jgi:hypothetical protein
MARAVGVGKSNPLRGAETMLAMRPSTLSLDIYWSPKYAQPSSLVLKHPSLSLLEHHVNFPRFTSLRKPFSN